jgi:hypothetical protein
VEHFVFSWLQMLIGNSRDKQVIGVHLCYAMVAGETMLREVQAKGFGAQPLRNMPHEIVYAKACITSVIIGCLVRAAHGIG